MTALAWLVRTLKPGNVEGLRRNLSQVFPGKSDAEIRDIMRRNTSNYGRFWVDLFRIPKMNPAARAALVRVDGEHYLQEALDAGKGCLVVSIHMGGWEGCASYWGARRDQFHTGLITEVLEPPALWRQVLRLRQSTGLEIIPLGRTAARDIIRRLRDNGVVAGAIDRDILGTARPRRFFGAQAPIPTGMFEVAQRTGAPILPVICLRDPGDTYRVIGFEAIPVAAGAEALEGAIDQTLRLFESCIRDHPDQWHVMAPIFTSNPTGAEAEKMPVAEEALVG